MIELTMSIYHLFLLSHNFYYLELGSIYGIRSDVIHRQHIAYFLPGEIIMMFFHLIRVLETFHYKVSFYLISNKKKYTLLTNIKFI